MKQEFPKVITSSLRGTFNSCHHKFYKETICGLAPKGQNIHLIFGKAYAVALEHFRIAYYGQRYAELSLRERYENAVADGFLALMHTYDKYEPAPGETKDFEHLVGAYIHYLISYPPATDHIKPSMFNDEPRVEFSFVFEIPNCYHPVSGDPLLYAGRFDMLAEFNGALIVFDDKTTTRMGPTWSQQWDLRSQFTGYVYGAQLSDKPTIGAIVRGLCILKTQCKTMESIQYRPPHVVERWKERLVWDVQRMLSMWDSEYWPHTGEESGACSDYGGCPFVTLCKSANEDRFIATEFQEYRWDPLAREGGSLKEVIANAHLQGNVFPRDSILSGD